MSIVYVLDYICIILFYFYDNLKYRCFVFFSGRGKGGLGSSVVGVEVMGSVGLSSGVVFIRCLCIWLGFGFFFWGNYC